MEFQLDTVIEVLLTADNQRRIEAQNYINSVPASNFQKGIDAFLLSMNHQNPQVAAMAALLLKKKYLDIKDNLQQIPPEKFSMLVTAVQNMICPQKQILFLRRCCEILVVIYSHMNHKKELIHVIERLANHEHYNIKMALMYLIEISCEFAFDDDLLIQYSGCLENIFQKGLEDQNTQLKVTAFKTLTIFLSSIVDEKLVKKFNGVLQVLLSKTIELVKFDQESGVTALQSLNELIQAHPKFIKPIINDILVIYSQIMQTSQLLTNLRTTSLYGILLLCMNHDSTIRKNEYFRTKMVPAYMRMLAENETTSLQEWAQELNDEIISKHDISLSTQEHLGQILNELGNKFLLPLFIGHCQQYISSGNSSYQHAGLTALAILTENCHQSYKKELEKIIGLIMPLMDTQNPRIMHDLLVAIGYMSEEFVPDLQTKYGDMILQFIIKSLNQPIPKVQYKAVQCLQNFQKGLEDHKDVKVLVPYLSNILGELAKIFESSLSKQNYLMLQGVLDSIATIASMNNFYDYYQWFMPGLKKIMSFISADSPQKVMIRSKTVETMGFLLSSVKDNEQLFQPDCQEIMTTLTTLAMQIDKDDTLHQAMFVVYENVAECLKSNFIAYSDLIFPIALEAVNRKVDFQIIDEAETEKPQKNPNMNKFVKMKIDLKLDGVKNLVLNTDSLAQKIEASNLLATMAEEMGSNFSKYIESLLPTVATLINFKNSKEIRNNMIQISKYMVLDCLQPQQKVLVLNHVYPALCQELAIVIKTKDHVETCAIVEVLAELMPFMAQEMAMKLPDMMSAVIVMVKSLVAEVEKIYSEKDMDDHLDEEMSDETAEIEEVLEHIETIMTKGKGIPTFDNLRKQFPKDYEFTE